MSEERSGAPLQEARLLDLAAKLRLGEADGEGYLKRNSPSTWQRRSSGDLALATFIYICVVLYFFSWKALLISTPIYISLLIASLAWHRRQAEETEYSEFFLVNADGIAVSGFDARYVLRGSREIAVVPWDSVSEFRRETTATSNKLVIIANNRLVWYPPGEVIEDALDRWYATYKGRRAGFSVGSEAEIALQIAKLRALASVVERSVHLHEQRIKNAMPPLLPAFAVIDGPGGFVALYCLSASGVRRGSIVHNISPIRRFIVASRFGLFTNEILLARGELLGIHREKGESSHFGLGELVVARTLREKIVVTDSRDEWPLEADDFLRMLHAVVANESIAIDGPARISLLELEAAVGA